MYIVELECESAHSFEGWYNNSQDYYNLKEKDSITCPVCDSNYVERKFVAPKNKYNFFPKLPFGNLLQTQHIKSQIVPQNTQNALKKLLGEIRKTYENIESKNNSESHTMLDEKRHIKAGLRDKE